MTIKHIPGTGKLHTTVCPICGAKRGADYIQFADHVRRLHGPEVLDDVRGGR